MDDIVKAALAKWPQVPHCYGWLGLDARGQWFMRDDRAQAAGPFAGPQATPASKGSWLRHDKLIEFIGRNYEADDAGQWFFQNGPQRVYVELEVAPWVWRLPPNATVASTESYAFVHSHTGRRAQVQACWLDDLGRLYLETDAGWGLVHSQDMLPAADAIEQGHWTPQTVAASAIAAQAGFVLSPASAQSTVPPSA